MQILANKWIVPIVAMVLTLTVSTIRTYSYLDGTLKAYAASFRHEDVDHFVYWTFHTQELQQMIDTITEKKLDLEKREEAIKAREAQIDARTKEFTDLKAQVESLRDGISTVLVVSKAEEMKNLKALSATYANMNPDAAVGVLNEMDENTVVKLLALMKADTVGPIFEAMARVPGQEGQMRARIARLSEKLRLYKQAQSTEQ